ncbi:MAG TPA: hypothetical protein VK702_01080 [Candidatus Acidoferrum sp.]|nr:hypothetical protein [Candidatus Acidoferrum sp.]
MGKADVIAAIGAGLTGAVTIFLYLTISLPLFFHISPLALYALDTANFIGVHAALHAGLPGILLGQAGHIVVSLVWGFIFVALSRRLPELLDRPVAWGAVYGVVVMLVMHYVVVPLGHAPRIPYSLPGLINNLVAHTLCFGVPVALVASRLMRAAARPYP